MSEKFYFIGYFNRLGMACRAKIAIVDSDGLVGGMHGMDIFFKKEISKEDFNKNIDFLSIKYPDIQMYDD